MPSAPALPDLLVLGAGGILGEAWMNGVLAGLEEGAGLDFRDVEGFVGTSAGSIVAARLAAGTPARRPGSGAPAAAPGERAGTGDEASAGADGDGLGGALRAAARVGWAVTAPLAPVAVAAGTPAGALARSALLARIPDGRRRLHDLHRVVARGGLRFDGRLRVCAVDRAVGRRVIFGAPGAPEATVADAVVASCSIPGVFRAVEIGGRSYVDGGAWSLTNLDAAPAGDGSEVLVLEATALMRGGSWRSPEGALRAAMTAATAVELQILRARGARVTRVVPDEGSAELMAGGLMRRGPADAVLRAGYRQGVALAGRRGRP